MVCEKKRVAYYRIPAKDIIYSNTPDFIGKQCGKMQTVFLRVGVMCYVYINIH
jgi:dysferlin